MACGDETTHRKFGQLRWALCFVLVPGSPLPPLPLRAAVLERGARFCLTTSPLSPYVSFAL